MIGDSNAFLLGKQVQKYWYSDTGPVYSDLLSEEESRHIVKFYNLGIFASGLVREFKDFKPFMNQSLFSKTYLKEHWSDIFKNETDKLSFKSQDIVIIWLGTNDNQDGMGHARLSPSWWDKYENKVKSIANTCQTKNLDCYWIGPAAVTVSQSLRGFLNGLNNKFYLWLSEYPNVTYLNIFNKFGANDFKSDGFHLNSQAEIRLLNELNAQITFRRGYNIQSNAQYIRNCNAKLH